MKPNPQYEAGFRRAVDLDAAPEDAAASRARRAKWLKAAAIGTLAIVVVAAAVAIVAALLRESPADRLKRAEAASAAGDHQGAIAQFRAALVDQPDQPALRFRLGQEYFATGDTKDAEIEFRKARELNYDPERTLPLLVASLAAEGEFEKIVALVGRTTVKSAAANAALQTALGTAYDELGRASDAAAAWDAARRFVPAYPPALLAEAKALVASGDYTQASARLDEIPPHALQDRDANASSRALLALRGDVAYATGHVEQAGTDYAAAVALDPTNLPLRSKLARVDVDRGRLDDARRELDIVFASKPNDPVAQYVSALAFVAKRNFAAAQAAITIAVQQMPRDGPSQLLDGRIALESGDRDAAELHLREAVALMPKNVEARRTLVDFYIRTQRAARAEEALAPLVASGPGDADVAQLAARVRALPRERTDRGKPTGGSSAEGTSADPGSFGALTLPPR